MRILFGAAAILLLWGMAIGQDLPPALPQADYEVNFLIKDSGTSLLLKDRVVNFLFIREEQQIRNAQLTGNDATASIRLDGGVWNLIAEMNDPVTPGNDYFGVLDLQVEGDANLTLFLMPVGTASGIVFIDNRTVPEAKIALKCASEFYNMGEYYSKLKTDEYGSFLLRSVPAGSCEIFGSLNGKTGSLKMQLRQGELKIAQINLMHQQVPSGETNYVAISMIMAAALLVAIVVYSKYFHAPKHKEERRNGHAPKKRLVTKPDANKPAMGTTRKMAAIIQTLNENERNIVHFLIRNGGKGRQNKIYHELLIPKVTLSRAIFGLENKNIIQTKRLGKVKELELTDWFTQ
ncbi:MAG: hypothetical protein V1835_01870 [Candidatus Micrarchaeota archaeon]